MIATKPTNSPLFLSEMAQKPIHQQFIAPNTLISLLFIIILCTSSVLSVHISDGIEITTGDDQTPKVQSGRGSLPKILSRGKREEISLVDETAHSHKSTSPDKRDVSSGRSPSRLLMTTNIARSYNFTKSAAAVSNSGGDELNALLAIKRSFVDGYGILASWTKKSGNKNKNSSFSHCRTWVGVTCNSLQQVVGINLTAGNAGSLYGMISPAFGSLKQLEVLDLSYNALEGGIPSELGNLPRLKVLWLFSNRGLNGSIPTSLGVCNSLQSLDLNNNNFSGSIPTSLRNCSSLRQLILGSNNFTGSISIFQLQNCSRLEILDLSNNQFSGSIPTSLGYCTSLESLNLNNNAFLGNIPPNLGYCQNLMYFDVTSNNLNGSIPSSIGDLKQLQILYFDGNQLTGNIPVIKNCSQLQGLSITSNNISGVIPSTLGHCSQLYSLDLSNNLLTGDIPPSLGNLQNLIILVLEGNFLMGSIPTTLGNLTHLQSLYLSANNLIETLGSLNELTFMDLGNNNFDSDKNTIPSSFCNLRNLISLYLTMSYLSGHIPTCLGKLRLHTLDLSYNNLTGPIPPLSDPGMPSFYHPAGYQMIILSNNHLIGPIPNKFANLTSIKHLDLGGNRLSGTIPNFILQWQQLGLLDLSSNMFTGKFPLLSSNYSSLYPYYWSVYFLDISNNSLNNSISLFLSNLYSTGWGKSLDTLRIGKNFFHGSLPLEFSLFEYLEYFSTTSNQITGPLPPNFGSKNSSVVLIDLSHNQVTGDICSRLEPQVAAHTLSALRVLTLANNKLTGPIPMWITRLKSLQVLDLSFNNLTGSIPLDLHSLLGYKVASSNLGGSEYFTLVQTVGLATQRYTYILLTTTYMDLSSNALTGNIPPSIVELSGLLYLYLSNNKLSGNIPTSLENLSQLERLDLSRNNLTGEIPPNLTSLSYLQIFNVSFNNLSGPIPTSGQFVSFSNASYLPGNDGLCGEVIHRLCNSTSQAPEPHVLKEAVYSEEMISLPGFLIGVGVGFSSVVFFLLYWGRGQDPFASNVRHNETLKQRYGAFKHPR